MNKQMTIAKKRYSFKKAYERVPLGQIEGLKKELYSVFSINNRTSWYNKLKGITSPSIEVVEAVETVFLKYGIENCWEITEIKL
ncbi:hypothetical protein K0F00_02820 [Bacteroides fragilis]|nr:hypothetical protein [Bacteroides fragilis]MCE8877770.1 hypothetical protein [Bacteroides fragilis]